MTAPMKPSRSDLRGLLDHRVRVYAGVGGREGDPPVTEGEVIAICFEPTILVRATDGAVTHHNSTLPIEVMEWRAL